MNEIVFIVGVATISLHHEARIALAIMSLAM
jgi:hypothetical protein